MRFLLNLEVIKSCSCIVQCVSDQGHTLSKQEDCALYFISTVCCCETKHLICIFFWLGIVIITSFDLHDLTVVSCWMPCCNPPIPLLGLGLPLHAMAGLYGV